MKHCFCWIVHRFSQTEVYIHLENSRFNIKYRFSQSLLYADGTVNSQGDELVHPFPHLIDQIKSYFLHLQRMLCGNQFRNPWLWQTMLLSPPWPVPASSLLSEALFVYSVRSGFLIPRRLGPPQLQRVNSDWTKPNTLVSFPLLSHWLKHGHVMQSWPIKLEGKLSGRVFRRICFKLKKITKTPTVHFLFPDF